VVLAQGPFTSRAPNSLPCIGNVADYLYT
jgi:hypothetical protein